jgi:sugar phosphate isomerase/epimerase
MWPEGTPGRWDPCAHRSDASIRGYDSIEIAVVLGWRDSLDLLTPIRRRRIKQLLQEFELALPAIAGNVDLLADDPADLAVEWAGKAGPSLVDTYLGGRPGEWATKGEQAAERLARLCDYAAARG